MAASGQATRTGTFTLLPLVLTLGGILLAVALAWFVPPIRSALARLVGGRR